MRKLVLRVFIIIVILAVGFSSCQKNNISNESINNSDLPTQNPDILTYEELEQAIRSHQDKRAVFSFAQYRELLVILSDTNFIVLPINEFKDSINSNKVMVGMRHDVDCHPFKALIMAQMENNYNLRSSYYILATAGYYGRFTNKGVNRFHCLDSLYLELHNLGNEIGIHNDLLAIMIEKGLEPLSFNMDELHYYDSLGIKVNGSVAHGSALAIATVPNNQIFSDYASTDSIEYEGVKYPIGEHSMLEYGFEYEAKYVNHTKYYSESGGIWNVGGFAELLEEIRNANPGDRIQILTHPVWWGKNE